MYYEKCIASEEVFCGRVIRVKFDTVQLPDGGTSTREVVHHNGGAAIVAVNGRGEVALVKQYRYALKRDMIEIPAGKVEQGEEPFKTAVRELEEEAGLLADEWLEFGEVIPTCGYCSEIIYLYVATKLRKVERNLDFDEFMDVVWMPLEEAGMLAERGEIVDSKTALGLLRAKLLYDRGELKV